MRERILYHACKASISYGFAVYHIANGDISLKNAMFYDIMPLKEGVFMSENKLLDLSFEFAVAIVNLVDGVTAPKSSYMTDQLARAEQERLCSKIGNCFEGIQRNKLLAKANV